MEIREAAGRAETELGTELVIIKKTSPEYALLTDKPPCPSVIVKGKFIAKGDVVTYEQLRTAILGSASVRVTGR
jgi:hypothetical protein